MVYHDAKTRRIQFRNLPFWASFLFASDPTATPLVKDSRTTYRNGSGESIIVSDVSVVTLELLELGNGPEIGDPGPPFIPQDLGVDWSPTSVDLGTYNGLQDFNTTGGFVGVTSLVIRHTSLRGVIDLSGSQSLISISFPNLVSFSPLGNNQGGLKFSALSHLTTVAAPALVTMPAQTGAVLILNNPILTSIDLHLLATYSTVFAMSISGNATLANLSLPALSVYSSTTASFQANALNAASVNSILATFAAIVAFGAGKTLNLQGGTNATPSGQGIVDKATIQGRGATVNTN